MMMNMLSFERNNSFQDKWNCLESLKTTRVWKTTRVRGDFKSLEDYKKHRKLQDHEESGRP
jgi:hypothetical protein